MNHKVSAANLRTDDLLRRYLSGAITAPEEAELERRAREDATLAEAMQGLRAFPEEDHAQRVRSMLAGVGQSQATAAGTTVSRLIWQRWSVAAGFLLLLGAAVFFLPKAFNSAGESVAMEAAPAPQEDAEISVAPSPELEIAAETLPEDLAADPDARDQRAAASNREPERATVPTATTENQIEAAEELAEGTPNLPTPVTTSPSPPPPPPPAPVEAVAMEEEIAEVEMADEAPPAPSVAMGRKAEVDTPTDVRSRRTAPESFRAPSVGQYLQGRISTVNGAPIPNALVRIPGLALGERSDSNGSFQIQVDQTISRLLISHPDYEDEDLEVPEAGENIQVSLSPEELENAHDWAQDAAATKIEIDQSPGYARPEEGYGDLRKRMEANRPEGVPNGKVKVSFLVNLDGSLTDFRFRGRPDSLTMEYVGRTLVETSTWNVVKGEKPVRVHFKLRFE
jgi:hypothetical protein